jgi:DNA replication initiation complex subunit (GINS family)
MSEEEDVLTFSEIRRIQKEEDQKEQITDLGNKFLLKVSNYFDRKKQTEGEDSREYRNAKRVLDKIISLRMEKIVREARLSVKTDKTNEEIPLLPEEQEVFRDLKHEFKSHKQKIEEKIENQSMPSTNTSKTDKTVKDDIEQEDDTEQVDKEEQEMKSEEQEDQEADSSEDGYTLVETTSSVPEFMGTDLEAYGPFDEGEEVKIPDDNAEILVNRGNAERIET